MVVICDQTIIKTIYLIITKSIDNVKKLHIFYIDQTNQALLLFSFIFVDTTTTIHCIVLTLVFFNRLIFIS